MKLFDLISMTLRNLFRRKTRTLLTITGVIVGTCAIVVMVSMGLGMTQAMEQALQDMGDLTLITIQNYGSSGNSELPKLDDAMLSKISQISHVTAVSPFWDPPYINAYLFSGKKDRYQMRVGYNVKGVYPEALPALGYQIAEGKMLSPSTGGKTYNIMFGSESAYNFEDTKRSWRNNTVSPYPQKDGTIPDPFVNPLKDDISLVLRSQETDEKGEPKYKDVICDVKITGIMQSDDRNYESKYYSFMDVKDLQRLYKEYKKAFKIKEESSRYGGSQSADVYTEVKVKVDNIDNVSAVDDAIKELGYDTYSLDSIREPMQKQMQQQQIFLGGLGAISLLVAAIGITNTMIMSIYERTREIGVMKVLGCKLSNIRMVFLMEAGLIGFWGGVFGIGISMGISKLLNYVASTGGGGFLAGMFGGGMGLGMGGELSVIPPWLIVSAIIFATVIGLVSGFYPANRAVKISALEAIKHE